MNDLKIGKVNKPKRKTSVKKRPKDSKSGGSSSINRMVKLKTKRHFKINTEDLDEETK